MSGVRHEALELVVYVCMGCAEQRWPGRDGLPRCQNQLPGCGKYERVVVRASAQVQKHLSTAKHDWESELFERLERFRAGPAAAVGPGEETAK